MTFYQVVNEIRKKNDGEFLYLNPHFCDESDKLVLFCDLEKLKKLPDGFEIFNSKLIDKTSNVNIEYEIRPLSILKNIDNNSKYRFIPVFKSEDEVDNSIKNIINEIKRLNSVHYKSSKNYLKILYYDDCRTFICNKELSSLILPDGFSKYGNSFITSDDNQYGFYFLRDYNLINYSSYIYPNISSNKVCNSIEDLANTIKLLNPNCKVGFKDNGIYSTIQINDLVMPDGYYIDKDRQIIHNGTVFGKIFKYDEAELHEKLEMGQVNKIKSNVFSEMNKSKKYRVYVLDSEGNFVYEKGADGKLIRKTKEGTLQESIDSLKRAKSALIAKKEAATKDSIEKSNIMTQAFFNGRRLALANNEAEYERVKNELMSRIKSYPDGDVNRTKNEIALSEFEKGYKFNQIKETIEHRNKHIIKKKVYSNNSENILVASTMIAGAGVVLFKGENPTAFFEYEKTEKFKNSRDCKPGFIARGCKKLLEKVKFYTNKFDNYSIMDDEVDINAYAR